MTCRAANTAGMSPVCAARSEDTQGSSILRDAHGDRPLVPSCAAQCASPHVLRFQLISRGPDLKGPVPASRTLMKEKRNSGNRDAGSRMSAANAAVKLCLYRRPSRKGYRPLRGQAPFLIPACAARSEDMQGSSIPRDAHGDRPFVPSCAAQCASPHVLRSRLISRGQAPFLGPEMAGMSPVCVEHAEDIGAGNSSGSFFSSRHLHV